MRTVHHIYAVVFTFVLAATLPSYGEEYPGCHGAFDQSSAMCSKFNFEGQRPCINPTNGTTFYDISGLPEVNEVDPHTRKMASLITNVFEEGDTTFAYASCLDIGDKRGYTCGYAGFTTGTSDAETVVHEYSKILSNNALVPFLSRLQEIGQVPYCDQESRGKVHGLESFCHAWRREACRWDQTFSKLQRDWTYKYYMLPSARYAAAYNIESRLGKAIFYDAIIQHGYQYVEPDINIMRLLELTGPRSNNESERSYLTRFLTTRRQLQCCYPDNVWPASASRSADLQHLVDNFDANKDLTKPVWLNNFRQLVLGTEDDLTDRKRCRRRRIKSIKGR
ncbi:hypothetical protein DFQ28_009972 [Apophysomyces sp. BC1034]|nr:hypothetical protein DFQ30_009543 [Apophysomyces sp. BC1015]KAG0172237.1 hypothetical protein DFQ29_008470 [Apophysomyces sp. BC1021]KAG0185086.1 hypothetical protein DFQ28_009972 [Apophysomyces sp. BC1034]